LTTPDNSVWGIINDKVALCHCTTNAKLPAPLLMPCPT
jgi:hypothetical protein